VTYYPTTDAQAALRRFRAGQLDMQSPVPLTELGWIRANLPKALHITPSLAVSYIAINLAVPALKDARVRRALNLAIDREVITRKILKLGEPPAYNYVPPGTAHYPGGVAMDFKTWPNARRLAEARRLMREAGYGAANRLRLTYATTASPDNRRFAVVFQAMVSQIYVKLTIDTADSHIHFRNLREHQYELAAANWYADFNDASNFLDLLRSDSANNYAGYRNPRFDAAMDAAAAEREEAKRGADLAAAECIALADYPWIVTRFASQSDLVSPRLRGWAANVRDFHPSRWLAK
jgi:oligopeptide transport system substrate-binding protein